MPFYISQSSLEDGYGEDTLVFDADDDRDQELDLSKVDKAIADAEAEVNSYVGKVYDLPLAGVTDVVDPESNTSVPPELRRVAADIAMYRLVPEHDRLTKERRKRYEDAIAWLKMLAAKEVVLSVPSLEPAAVIRVSGPDRIFTRSKMDGLV